VLTLVIQDMVTRVLAAYYKLDQQQNYPPLALQADVQADHGSLIRQVAAAGTVLLKNSKGALPLKTPASIAIIGSDAGSNPKGPNSCTMNQCDSGVLAMGARRHLHIATCPLSCKRYRLGQRYCGFPLPRRTHRCNDGESQLDGH
jgi:beta-glucosidase-like glycosyl hydrolase